MLFIYVALAYLLSHQEREAAVHRQLGMIGSMAGSDELAEMHFGRAEEIIQRIGHRWHATQLHLARGEAALKKGQLASAKVHFENALTIASDLASLVAEGEAKFGIARCAAGLGKLNEARQYGMEALDALTKRQHFKAETAAEWLRSLTA